MRVPYIFANYFGLKSIKKRHESLWQVSYSQ